MSLAKQKYRSAKTECDNHIQRLQHAINRTNDLFPLDHKTFDQLTADQVAFIDQLIFRFSKLQDTMGKKLIPSGLNLLGESVESLTMIDNLNLLEKLKIINSKQDWLELRELRNQIAHEYPDEKLEQLEALNLLHQSTAYLITLYQDFTRFVESKLPD